MDRSVLMTDFYQLAMAQAYFRLGMCETAVFELFVRRLPAGRSFLLAAGLQQAVEFLEDLRFTAGDIDFLAGMGVFPADFLAHLEGVRFTGSLHAMPEGTPFFADEPILRVTAPILEAQLVESRLLNLVHFQTLIASKAIRCVGAARGRRLVDFGMRRAHGAEAALLAARAAYLAGFDATATVEAGREFGIPLSGTVAHSFIEAHDSEVDAFRRYLEARGRRTALLIDTYDTERAAYRVAALSRELAAEQGLRMQEPGTQQGRGTQQGSGMQGLSAQQAPGAEQGAGAIQAVRIDSGDLAAHARAVRRILDEQGCPDVQIVLSGSLDEYRIDSLVASGTPVDAFGVGTQLDVSADAPALDMAYKLEEYAGRPRRKRSPGKQTWAGVKQVFREYGVPRQARADSIALVGESAPGEPLLREVMKQGRRVDPLPGLVAARDYCREQVAQLPPALRTLDGGASHYEVRISPGLQALAAAMDAAPD